MRQTGVSAAACPVARHMPHEVGGHLPNLQAGAGRALLHSPSPTESQSPTAAKTQCLPAGL